MGSNEPKLPRWMVISEDYGIIYITMNPSRYSEYREKIEFLNQST